MPQLYVLTWEFVTKMHKCDFVLKCVMVRVCVCTKRFTDLDKFDFSNIKFAYCDIAFRLEPIFSTAPASSRYGTCFRSGQKGLKNNHLVLLV